MLITLSEDKGAASRLARRPLLFLSLLYLAGVLLRLALAFAESENPVVMADESLYFNLARALWGSGELALRGQPVAYSSMLYPLLLSPLQALPPQVDMHRAVQVFNAIFMNLAVFPAWLLAERINVGRGAWFVAAAALLLPDMAMTELAMTESVGYPLTLFTFYLMHRAFCGSGLASVWGAAFCCFLLFFLKPGFAVVGGVFSAALLCRFLFAYRAKSEDTPEAARSCAAGTLLWLALCIAAHVAVHSLWRENFAIDGVYRNLSDAFFSGGALKGLNGVLLYAYYFAAACLIVPAALPAAHIRSLPRPDRLWVGAVSVSAALILCGVCFSIYIDEYTGAPFSTRIHLRYAAAYMVLLLIPCFSPHLEDKRMNLPLFGILAFCATGMILFGFGAVQGGKPHPVDSLAMAAVLLPLEATDMKTLLRFLYLFGMALLSYVLFVRGWTRRTQMAFAAALCLFWTVGGAFGYALLHWNDDPRWAADAREVASRLYDKDILLVAADRGYFWNPSSALDIRLRKPPVAAELDDLIANTAAGGAYSSFLPRSYWKEKPAKKTVRRGWLVMDSSMLYAILPTNPERVVYSPNGLYAALEVKVGEPWVHSAISGLNQGWVWQNSSLSVFDAALCAKDTIRVYLHVRAGQGTSTLTLSAGGHEQSFSLNDTLQWISADIPAPKDGRPFRMTLSSKGNVLVSSYKVE